MSADLLSVLQAINQANYKGMKPTDLCFGTVVQPEPAITIQLEGTMQPIPSAAIVLCDSVRARQTTAMDSRGDTVTVTLSEALQAGERVVMLRCAQGQRFVVLSRA
ncbi:MAG: DUF2577 family protein [Oscillospiraceae bacterium]|nr:DUF2577 family protein [Oscillospiraceae bacterium]